MTAGLRWRRSPVALLLVFCAARAGAQGASLQDSAAALLGAHTAIERFERRWNAEIEPRVLRPVFPTFAVCELRIGVGFCYGPENGKMPYSQWSTMANADRFAVDLVPPTIRRRATALVDGVLAELRRYQAAIPGDRFITGQLVRLNLERGEPGEALNRAVECLSDRWWCDVLRAHVLHLMGGQAARSDSIWTEAMYRMPVESRCRWLDPSDVIRSDSLRRAVQAMSCERKVDFAERLWWLADPLYSTRGNERRSEHLSRQAALLLDATARQRLDSSFARGVAANARQTALDASLDQGLSVFSLLNAPPRDRSLTGSLNTAPPGYDQLVRRLGVPGYLHPTRSDAGHARQLAALYPYPRFSFIPSEDALVLPVAARKEHWRLRDDRPYEFHARPAIRFYELDVQAAIFRRGDSALVLVASELTDLEQTLGNGATGSLFIRSDYSTEGLVLRKPVRHYFAATAAVPRGGALISLEVLSQDSAHAGRVRFGAHLPERTSSRLSLSDVLLLHETSPLPEELSDAEGGAMGSLRIERGGSAGIFLELYGAGRGEKFRIEVTAVREADGRLPRIGLPALSQAGIARLSSAWEAHASGRPMEPIAKKLDLSGLSAGRYTLSVLVQVEGEMPVESLREIEIVGR